MDQPWFLNGAAVLETTLNARCWKRSASSVSSRVRDGVRFAPRTIDLDLLLYGAEIVEEPGLTAASAAPRAPLRARAAGVSSMPGSSCPGAGPRPTSSLVED